MHRVLSIISLLRMYWLTFISAFFGLSEREKTVIMRSWHGDVCRVWFSKDLGFFTTWLNPEGGMEMRFVRKATSMYLDGIEVPSNYFVETGLRWKIPDYYSLVGCYVISQFDFTTPYQYILKEHLPNFFEDFIKTIHSNDQKNVMKMWFPTVDGVPSFYYKVIS